ncbi:MAG: hypothetical protein KKF68_03885 [Nanoarchaeota archaeon]|nr:hypothetical protein [Nanoarchaeota archaeon]
MNFIKKIFDKEADETVHLQFQKFSRGEFRDRALVKVKQAKGKFTISTSAEFANELVKIAAEKVGGEKVKIIGAVVSTNDLTGQIEFKAKKQFQGVKRYLIEKELSGQEILNLLEKFPKAFFALSFKTEKDETVLKIKPKAPKSGKPKSKENERLTPTFCKMTTFDEKVGKSFVFEKSDFKDAEANHTFFIEEIIPPKGETDFAKIRELAKRKGKITREAIIDGEKIVSEVEFIA